MRRGIGLDIHRTFGDVVIWENGALRHAGRVDMTRSGLEGFAKGLRATDEVVIEATGNCTAVSRVLSLLVKRVVIANPLQVKAIAHAHVKTDKVDAGRLASLHAAGYLPEIWTLDAETERLRRLVAWRYQVVRYRTRLKNKVHAILHGHLIPKCPYSDRLAGQRQACPAPVAARGAEGAREVGAPRTRLIHHVREPGRHLSRLGRKRGCPHSCWRQTGSRFTRARLVFHCELVLPGCEPTSRRGSGCWPDIPGISVWDHMIDVSLAEPHMTSYDRTWWASRGHTDGRHL